MCYYQGRTRQACESRERALAELAERKKQLEEQERKDHEQNDAERASEQERRRPAA